MVDQYVTHISYILITTNMALGCYYRVPFEHPLNPSRNASLSLSTKCMKERASVSLGLTDTEILNLSIVGVDTLYKASCLKHCVDVNPNRIGVICSLIVWGGAS